MEKRSLDSIEFDPAAFLKTIAIGRTLSTHKKGEAIFAQGEAADAVFYIQAGKVKIAIVSQHGKEAVVALLGPDEFFGEGCLLGQPKRLARATAMTETVTMRVEKLEIQRIIKKENTFSQMFISHILARNARISIPITAIAALSVWDMAYSLSLAPLPSFYRWWGRSTAGPFH